MMAATDNLFWQQRIKLPRGNFSTGQLPIFQPCDYAIIIDLELCIWMDDAPLSIDYAQ